jgi:hypothetical protein
MAAVAAKTAKARICPARVMIRSALSDPSSKPKK